LFFARTLQADAEAWRSALEEQIKELDRQRTCARQEWGRLAGEREKLARAVDLIVRTQNSEGGKSSGDQ